MLRSIFAAASLLVWLSGTSAVVAIEKSDENKITILEKKMFFKTYGSESIEKRLDRLEKRFFGEPSSAPLEERLHKVFEAGASQIEAETNKPVQTPAQVTSGQSQEGSSKKPAKKKELPGASDHASGGPGPGGEAEMAWERANLAAQAQRDAEIRNLLKEGIHFWKRKEADQAIEKFNQVIRLDPENAEAHFSLGVVFEARGQLEEADKAYRKAHDSNPDRLDYKEAITTVQEKLAKAKENQDKQAEIDKETQEAAEAFKRKEYLTAIELYKKLANNYPKNAAFRYNIGTIYLIMGSPVQALEYYEMARKLSPKEERYIAACQKLKGTVEADSAKRNQANEAWDQKEDEAKRRARDKEKERERLEKERRAAAAGKAAHKTKPSKPGKNGAEIGTSDMERMLQGFNQQSTGSTGPKRPTGYQPPVNNGSSSMPAPSSYQGGYQLNQGTGPGFGQSPATPVPSNPVQNFGQPAFAQGQSGQTGFMPNQQQGFPQQGFTPVQQGFNSQQQGFAPVQQGFTPQQQAGFTPVQQGFNQQQQAGFTPVQQGFNQQQQSGFTPVQQGFNQQQQPGFTPVQQGFNQQQQSGFTPVQSGFQGPASTQGFASGGQNFPGQQGFGGQANIYGVSPLMQPGLSQADQSPAGQNAGQHPAARPAAPAQPTAKSGNHASKPLTGAELLASLGIIAQPSAKGVTVTTVGIGSRAAKAGILPADVVLAVDGVSVTSLSHFASLLYHKQNGASAKMLINRKGTIGQVVL